MGLIWQRAWLILGRGVLALVLTLLAGGVWSVLLTANLATTPAVPWAVPVTAALLWLAWEYLGGRWRPRSTSEARRRYLRANPLSLEAFAWALVAGLSAVVALSGFWIVLHEVVRAPGNPLPAFSAYPFVTSALAIAMASLVSAVTEETGLRGYLQVALERELPAPVAIGITCLVLAPGHGLTQGFAWTTLLFYLFADLTFGVTAYLTNSILPGIVVHGVGILAFFTLVWPGDASRRLIWDSGADLWFWVHCGQVAVFAALAVLAFARLAQVARHRGETPVRRRGTASQ